MTNNEVQRKLFTAKQYMQVRDTILNEFLLYKKIKKKICQVIISDHAKLVKLHSNLGKYED